MNKVVAPVIEMRYIEFNETGGFMTRQLIWTTAISVCIAWWLLVGFSIGYFIF